VSSPLAAVAEAVGLKLLELAVREYPPLGSTLSTLVHDAPDDLPLVPQLRALLPVEGAAARALRALERR
jgi:hypothetical protein